MENPSGSGDPKKLLMIVGGLLVIGGIVWMANSKESADQPKEQTSTTQTSEEKPTTKPSTPTTSTKPASTGSTSSSSTKSIRIVYSNGSFTPNNVTIKVGQTVTFVNQHSGSIQISSDPHPLHTSYPALNLMPLAPGAAFTTGFILSPALESETIRFHNHLFPQATGVITVKR